MQRPLAPLLAALFLSVAGGARAQTSDLEILIEAGRIVPVALGAEQTARDVRDRVRARFFAGEGAGVSGWARMRGSTLDFDADTDGRVIGGAAGVDGFALGDVLVGGRVGYEDTGLDTAFFDATGRLDAQAVSFTPYGAWRIGGTWVIDGFAQYVRTGYDLRRNGLVGETDSDRFVAGVGASADYRVAGLALRPDLGILAAFDSAVRFSDNAGGEVVNDRAILGLLRAGGEAAWPIDLGRGAAEPFVTAHLVGTLDDVGAASLVGDTLSGSFGAGVRLRIGRAEIVAEGEAGGIGGRDFREYLGMLRVSVPF